MRRGKFTEFRHFSFADGMFFFRSFVIFFLSRSFDSLSLFPRTEKSQLIFTPIWITILFFISMNNFTGKKIFRFQHRSASKSPTTFISPSLFAYFYSCFVIFHLFLFSADGMELNFSIAFLFFLFLQLFFAFPHDFSPCIHPIPIYFRFLYRFFSLSK